MGLKFFLAAGLAVKEAGKEAGKEGRVQREGGGEQDVPIAFS